MIHEEAKAGHLSRVLFTQRVVACGAILGVLISWKLWVTSRHFPHFPVVDGVPQPPYPTDIVLVLALLAAAAGIAAKPLRRAFPILFLALGAVLLFLDQMRWQPWFYFYLLMTLPLAVSLSAAAGHPVLLHIQRMVVVGVLFWGGVHKLDFMGSGFANLYEGYLLAPVIGTLEGGLREAVLLCGRLIPWIELGIALGLCFNRTRSLAAILACSMHLIILLLIAPREHANVVVWPWNICMLLIALSLFFRGPPVRWREAFLQGGRLQGLAALVAVLVLAMPAAYYTGLWDRYLSFHLYSGRQQQVVLFLPATSTERLDPALGPHMVDSMKMVGYRELNLAHWSVRELDVPFISEERIMRRAMEIFCRSGDGGLFFAIYHPWIPCKPARQVFCGDLSR